jgi:hypothetical protein
MFPYVIRATYRRFVTAAAEFGNLESVKWILVESRHSLDCRKLSHANVHPNCTQFIHEIQELQLTVGINHWRRREAFAEKSPEEYLKTY